MSPSSSPSSSSSSSPSSASSASTFHSLIASSAAALCSRLVTHPLDTVKTRVQVSNTPLPLLPTFRTLLRDGALYRGLPIAMTLSVPGLSVYLTAYDLSKDAFARRFPYLSSDSVLNHMASAVVAEVSSGLFWTPMEVLKSKQQVENLSRPKSKSAYAQWSRRPISTQQLAKKIFDREGLLGFYRGYFITLGVFVPYSMIYFATYEQLKDMAWRQQGHLMGPRMAEAATAEEEVAAADRQQEDTLPFLTIMSCAAVAAGIAGGVSNVVDVVKTRWQISVLATTEENSSTRRIIQHMISQGGLSSFTRGMGARILWMIPSVTISMSVFEWLKAHGFT